MEITIKINVIDEEKIKPIEEQPVALRYLTKKITDGYLEGEIWFDHAFDYQNCVRGYWKLEKSE